jgi:hypothetical protein
MNTTTRFCGLSLLLAVVGGCAASPPLALNDPIGPAKVRPIVAANAGRLKVYSMSYVGSVDGDIERYVHSQYTIYAADGKKVRSVPNQTGVYNADPDIVALPVGTYRVKAEAYGVGWVSVPVVVELARTTVVDLNDEWWTDHPLADRAVTLPNGSVIGAGVKGEDSAR